MVIRPEISNPAQIDVARENQLKNERRRCQQAHQLWNELYDICAQLTEVSATALEAELQSLFDQAKISTPWRQVICREAIDHFIVINRRSDLKLEQRRNYQRRKVAQGLDSYLDSQLV